MKITREYDTTNLNWTIRLACSAVGLKKIEVTKAPNGWDCVRLQGTEQQHRRFCNMAGYEFEENS